MENEGDQPLLSIGELADQVGVSRRTVRYYVQRGLIDPPVGLGRGSGYTSKHAEQIQRVLRLQREGLPLESIGQLADSQTQAVVPIRPVIHPQIVVRLPLIAGIRLEIEEGATVPSPEVLDALAEACARVLQKQSPNSNVHVQSRGAASDVGSEHSGGGETV
jgi:DNA-binding transcriptional MerR regulator